MIRKILIEPEPILRKKCDPVEKVDDELRKLMNDMIETMYKAPGIGLAVYLLKIVFEERPQVSSNPRLGEGSSHEVLRA